MIRRSERAWALLVAAALVAPASAAVLTGEVRALGAQQLITPQSNSSPVVIRYYVPEGAAVKAGQVVLRIDPGQSASMIPELEAQIEQAEALAAKEIAELEVKALDAELALVDADSARAVAALDARIPAELVSALDHDRYRGELERTTREASLARAALADARQAVVRRQEQGRLEVRKLAVQRDYHAAMVRTSEVRAERDGIVVHGFNNNWIGGRIDEGSSAMPGSKAGEVVSGGEMGVRAWALEPDRRGLAVDQVVEISFDALPGRRVTGTISAIGGAPERKPAWGDGRYFVVDVVLGAGAGPLPLMPGMSVRLRTSPTPAVGTSGTGR
jgi:multidrug resistance efflux pump